jgi:hypothetical protein
MANLQPSPYQDIKNTPIALQIWYNQVRQFVGGGLGSIPWSSVSKSGSNITDIPLRDHENLTNIFGGAAANHYHMRQTEYTSFTTLSTQTSTPYTILSTDGYLLIDATTGPKTVTLPSAATLKRLHIKKIDSSANAVTISGTIEGVASRTLATQYKSFTIYSDGVSLWYIESST